MKVYGASKLAGAPMWLALREQYPFVEWTAKWPEIVGKIPDSKDFAKTFWKRDIDDVLRSDFVLVYGPGDDVLMGAIFEAGIAIGAGIPVVAVGDSPSFSTWVNCQGVYRAPTIEKALWTIAYILDENHEGFLEE